MAGLRAAADERARRAELERVQAEGETREALARAAEQRRRRRILLTASGIIALLFLVGFAGVSWQWRVAETARDDEKSQRDRAEQALKIVESEEEAGRKLQYTTDMQLAPFLWKDDRTTAEQLRVLLARHIPERMKANAGKTRATAPIHSYRSAWLRVALLPASAGKQRRGFLGARCLRRRRCFHLEWSTRDAGCERPGEALGAGLSGRR